METQPKVKQTHLYKVGDVVTFKRNSAVSSDGTSIVAIVEKITENQEQQNTYIIESSIGWKPSPLRMKRFNLVEEKTYIFVSEDELTLVKS